MAIKSKWLRFLPFIPALILLVTVNIFGDAANRFHDIGDTVAELILKGNPTYIGSSNVNERHLKLSIIKNMPDSVECIALGSSLVMCVNSEDIGLNNFYNLGVSGAGLYDILGMFGAMEFFHKQTSSAVICFEKNFFTSNIYDSFQDKTSDKRLKPYAMYMLDIINSTAAASINKEQYLPQKEIKLLFSLSYFQACIEYLSGMRGDNDSEGKVPSRFGVVYEGYSGGYYMPDGSSVFPKKAQDRTEDYVVFEAEEYVNFKRPKGIEHVNEDSKMIFEKLIQYCINNSIEIKFFLCPYSPALWELTGSNERLLLAELEEFAHLLAEKYSLEITGSYNPYKVNISNKEYYDAHHLRREVLSKYFDFKFH